MSRSASSAVPRLSGALARRLAVPRSIARREQIRLFLVGGAVRDLLLGLAVSDIDLAVEGDAVVLARRVGEALGSPARVHGRFGTATVELDTGERLDFAATRREQYPRPGALPDVAPASIEEDLLRRDFTVNAMALPIAPRRARLLDPYGGQSDLARRRLKILHRRSFQDDPTRAYRAARYANRLGFSVERATRLASLDAVARGSFDTISGDRRRREIRLLFSERNRAGAVRWMARLGLTATLHPALDAAAETLARLRRAERLPARLPGLTIWILYVLVWSAHLTSAQAAALARRLALAGPEERMLRCWPETLERLSRLPVGVTLSSLDALGLSDEEAAAAAVCSPRAEIRGALGRTIRSIPLELSIRGRDLVRAGVAPGPAVGRALRQTLAARRDGKIGPESELEFALKTARGEAF